MIKVFVTNDKEGKITLTKEELEDLLAEAYNEGVLSRRVPNPLYPDPNPLQPWISPYSTPYYTTTPNTPLKDYSSISCSSSDLNSVCSNYGSKISSRLSRDYHNLNASAEINWRT